MPTLRTLTGILLVVALSAPATGQAAVPAAKAGVPDGVIKNIEGLFLRPRKPLTREQLMKLYAENMAKVLKLGAAAEAKFVKSRKMNWIHTFSGKGWNDPTATAFGVRGIPSIWVIGKDGKVVSSNARRDLEGTIEKALKSPKSSK